MSTLNINNDYIHLNSASSDKVVVEGNLGIGTTSPSQKLHVYSATGRDFKVNQATANVTVLENDYGIELRSNNGYNAQITANGTSSFGDIRFFTNSSERMRVTPTGNVGIGTTSPSYKLQVKDTSAGMSDGDQVFSVGNTTGGTQLAFGSLENSYNWIRSYESGIGGRDLVFGTDAEKMRLTAGGNVLIGTTTDSGYKLSVAGASNTYHIYPAGSGVDLYSTGNIAPHYQSNFDWYTGVPGSGSFKMRLDSSGNLGIGTTSPSGRLEINGDGTATGGLVLREGTNQVHYIFPDNNNQYNLIGSSTPIWRWGQYLGDTKMILNNTGLGIGTTSPSATLDVVSSINGVNAIIENDTHNAIFQILASVNAKNSELWFGDGADSDVGKIDYDHADNSMAFNTNAAERMRIASDGKVGIGISSPGKKLDVNGSTKIRGNIQLTGQATGYETSFNGSSIYSAASTFNGESSMFGSLVLQSRGDAGKPIVFVTGATPTERMRITSAGNLGVGTSSPGKKLDVNGTARAVKSEIDFTPTSDTIALDIRGTGTPNDYFTLSNATGGANDVFLPIFFYKAATYGYEGGTNRYTSGVYGGGFVAAVDDTSYPNAAGAGAAMHFNARTYANNGPLTNRYLFSWGSWLTTHMAMTAGGNLLIGKTTDSGEELQVNGSTDVSGDINADGDFYQNGTQGWSGTINIPTNPPVTITVQGGIITNVT